MEKSRLEREAESAYREVDNVRVRLDNKESELKRLITSTESRNDSVDTELCNRLNNELQLCKRRNDELDANNRMLRSALDEYRLTTTNRIDLFEQSRIDSDSANAADTIERLQIELASTNAALETLQSKFDAIRWVERRYEEMI